MKKIVLDTNVYIDWLNRGLHETVMLGPGLVRYLSAVVVMELRAGVSHRASRDAVDALTRGYRSAGRLVAPSSEVFERAGAVLRKLKLAGRNVRDASLSDRVGSRRALLAADHRGRVWRGRASASGAGAGREGAEGRSEPSQGSHINDVLIALTARSIGATVVTANAAEFAAIQQVEPFAFELP